MPRKADQELEVLTIGCRSIQLFLEVVEHGCGEGVSTLPNINEFLYLDLGCMKYVSLEYNMIRHTRKGFFLELAQCIQSVPTRIITAM